MRSQGSRLVVAGAGAALVTLGLFMVMTRMISGAAGSGPQLTQYNVVDFVRLIRPRPHEDKEPQKLPDRKPPPKPPPPPKPLEQRLSAPPAPSPHMPLPDINTDPRLAGGPVIARLAPKAAGAVNDNEAIPLVQVPPVYPARAERLHLGGTVVVEFIIDAAGRVADPKVLRSKPRRIFDQAALQAIVHWRFKPKLEDGKPVARRARQRFDFKPPS